jgi:transposase InsO family protein
VNTEIEIERSKERSKAHAKSRRPWPQELRLAVVRAVLDEGLSTFAVAGKLGVPYTTAIQWVKAYRQRGAKGLERKSPARRPNLKKPTSEPVAAAILSTHRAEPAAGSRRIRDVMRRFLGIGTSATTVRRVLRAQGIKPQVAKRRVKRKAEVQHFERAEPNQLWQSDLFTFLLRRHERIYVAAFLDDHSRYLVSLVMAHHQRSVLVLEALARGIAEYGSPKEILTDQGRQYTAWRGSTEFEAELKRHGIHHIKSRPHHPQTCGKIERFWKTLWEEHLSRTVFADFDDCQRRVALFIQHYNFKRPHQGLEGATPADRFFRAASTVRQSIEAQVADNALRMAHEQPARKPFYLAGQLGDRSVAISASGAALNVRLGDEHTTIPFDKERGDEEHSSASRWVSAHCVEEAAAPQAQQAQPAAVADAAERAAGDRPQPLSDDLVGALGAEVGEGGDRAGEGLSCAVLPAGGSGASGDALRVESAGAGGVKRASAVGAGTSADPCLERAGEAADAAQKECGAAVAPVDQVEPRPRDDGAAWPAEEGAHGSIDDDDAWRRLALIWERKLCGAEEGVYERADTRPPIEHLHTEPRGAEGAHAAPGGDRGGAGGDENRRPSGTHPAAVAQPLPNHLASIAARDDRIARAEGGGAAGQAASAERACATTEEARARERAPEEARGGDR